MTRSTSVTTAQPGAVAREMGPNFPEFNEIMPAHSLEEIAGAFEPASLMDPSSRHYIPRTEYALQRLKDDLLNRDAPLHSFLCGHRGCGKTTEFIRLLQDSDLQQRYLMVYLSARKFNVSPHYTEDALLLEIASGLVEFGRPHGLEKSLEERLFKWSREVVETYVSTQAFKNEAGVQGNVWLARFASLLEARREWKTEQKMQHKPKVEDLLQILNEIGDALSKLAGKPLLVILDDFEKSETEGFREMYMRVFQDGSPLLTRPRFHITYTTPVFLRALQDLSIPSDLLYAFPAIHLYDVSEKSKDRPQLDPDDAGVALLTRFIRQRLANQDLLPDEEMLELIRIGGGLFRETSRAVMEAARSARFRHATRIETQDVKQVFNLVKKEHQPRIRGNALKILRAVLESKTGWVDDVEPFLLSKLVVEYENGDVWLDLRYPLKEYVRSL